MALSLLGQNRCSFGGCQQYFASTDDLIAHIEFTHIPSLEEEYRQKLNQAQSGTEENRASATPNLPLSCVYRLFRPAYNPVPCEPDVVRINFNHYRKRTHESSSTSSAQGLATTLKREEPSQDYNGEDLNECGINETEDRFRCLVAECGKRFRSNSGLRLHSRTTHGVILKDSTPNVLSNGSGSRPSHSSHPPPTVSPTKYAASRPYKCQQCSKRYKTTAGLSNHVEQSHKKQSGGCGTPSSTDSAPASPSPAVLDQLISQARAHGQATAAQEQLRAQQRPLPVQVACAPNHQYGQVTTQAPLPVRSLPNTHPRYAQCQVPGQQNPQMIQQHHVQSRRSQFGSQQSQLVPSSSPHQAHQSSSEGNARVLTKLESEESSRTFGVLGATESGPILLAPKQAE